MNWRKLSPPANDNFKDAIELTDISGQITGTNVEALEESGEPNHIDADGEGGGHSVWYSWTAMESDILYFDTKGSSFETGLAVYTGSTAGRADKAQRVRLFFLNRSYICFIKSGVISARRSASESIPDNFFNIGNRFRFVPHHETAFAVPLRYIFINAVIPAHQFRETEVPQFAVAFRSADADAGQNFLYHAFACGTNRQRRIIYGLLYFKYFAPQTGFIKMFVFIRRHGFSSL